MTLVQLLATQFPVTARRVVGAAITASATPGAWSTVLNLPGHRLYIVATPPDDPLMLTRVHLNGTVQTRLSREWFGRATMAEIESVAAEHHRKVTAGLAGWPTIIAALQLTSWGGLAWLTVSTCQEAVTAARRLLDGAAPGWDQLTWHLWGALVPLALGPSVRLAMRGWFRYKLNAVAA